VQRCSEVLCATTIPIDKLMDLASVISQLYGRAMSLVLIAKPRGAFQSITAVLYPVYNMYECFNTNYSSFIPGV
jgi:hypothetical protein